ncbi:MAG: hypothetical protein LBU48_02055 [Coriobacteriales bacterium]|jgi:hypothetical protein|nr:hypothetical protein [Coriobacteriales bacterium]
MAGSQAVKSGRGAHAKEGFGHRGGLSLSGKKKGTEALAPGEKPKAESPILTQLGKLRPRERALLVALLLVVAMSIYMIQVFLPNMETLASRQGSINDLQSQRLMQEADIATLSASQQAYEDAVVQRDDYAKRYFGPLLPEQRDKLITNLLLESGFVPESLVFTGLLEASVAPYYPNPLDATALSLSGTGQSTDSTTGAGSGTGAGAGADGSAGAGDGTGDGASASGMDTETAAATVAEQLPQESTEVSPSDTMVAKYTVTVAAQGDKTALYALLDRVLKQRGIELVSYSCTPSVQATQGSDGTLNPPVATGTKAEANSSAAAREAAEIAALDTYDFTFVIYVTASGQVRAIRTLNAPEQE